MRIVRKKPQTFVFRGARSHIRALFSGPVEISSSPVCCLPLCRAAQTVFRITPKKSRKMATGLGEALDSLQKACFAFTPFSSLIKPSAKRQRIALARRVLQIVAGAKKWLFEIRLPRGDAPSRPRALRRPLSENPAFRRNILPDELQFVLESISSYACF